MNRSFRGATEADARAAAAEALGVSADALDVRELVRRMVGDGDEAREEIELVVRVAEAPEIDEAELLKGFAPRKVSAEVAVPEKRRPKPAPRAEAPAPRAREEKDEGRVERRPSRDDGRGPRRPAPDVAPADAGRASPEALAPRARDFLSGLLQRMGVEAELRVEVDDENVYIEMVASDGLGGLLIGRKGQTLDSLQYLTNRVVLPGAQARGRVYLDTENYREKHRRKLEKRALELRDEALREGRSITVDELNPRDRWIIHQALMDDDRVTTKSVGEADERRLMIIPS